MRVLRETNRRILANLLFAKPFTEFSIVLTLFHGGTGVGLDVVLSEGSRGAVESNKSKHL